MKELEKKFEYFPNGDIRSEYQVLNWDYHGIYKGWRLHGEMEFIDQNKKGDEHGVKIIFKY